MIGRFVELFTICGLLWPPIVAGATAEDAWRDIRVAREVWRLDLDRIGVAGDENWAVLRITPGPWDEGDAGRTSKWNDPKSRLSIPMDLVAGTARSLGVLRGTVREGPWPCYAEVPKREIFGVKPIYMEDRSLGTCIGRVNEHANFSDRTVVEECYLIPDDWAEGVKPALEYWRTNRERFVADRISDRRENLRLLTKDGNPIISFFASKNLAVAGGISLEDVPAHVIGAPDMQDILVDFLLLRFPSSGKNEAIRNAFSQQIEAARKPEELRGMAVSCALDLANPVENVRSENQESYRLLIQIENRGAVLTAGGAPDAYLDGAMKTMRQIRFVLELRKKREAAKTRPAG